MRRIKITDVGPITKTATIEFKRFCILIGPQSNGKSTIAKILSTCMWLEKEACTNLAEHVVTDGRAFKALVEDFHRMHNYIHPDRSVIEYESPYIHIVYDKGSFSMAFRDNLAYRRIKVSYVPSDRNIITMKDIEKRDLEPTNFRSFLFDWLDTNRNFNPVHKMPILNLGMQYYHDDAAKDRKDMLTHENGVTYDIPLYDASSGMQSLVPMTVLMHYLTSGYLENYGKDISYEQQQRQTRLAKMLAQMGGVDDIYQNLVLPHGISFILEEPEQNLFPQTQVDLFNDIVALCNGKHSSSVFMTTHSPYVLAAANILLFANKLLAVGVAHESIVGIISSGSSISGDDFSAYSVSDGTCRSLIDEGTGLISENELDSASDYNAGVFDKLYHLYIQKMQHDDSRIS